jgi:hypothetical protein
MSLEKLQQQAKELQALAATDLSTDQLSELLSKAMSLLEESEQSLINTTLIEINENKIEDETDNS